MNRSLERLDEITRRLRRDCPWDREQDERSIVPHTVEEAYELAAAVREGDDEKLIDELGDVLFQVVFLSLLMEERKAGNLDAVAGRITEKLVRRHPHVFGEADVRTAGEVRAQWERIKEEEEGEEGEPLAGEPEGLPALIYARKVLRRSDPDDPSDRAGNAESREAAERWVGELLLGVVDVSRRLGVDPELALRASADSLRAGA